ncbi:hypothetical protein SAMN05216228_101765 [Rhizobium tibeticum]|uniref:Uncharacterized protein n=1 Tax=Rhizobium tibeticum TaxID=501024 RepID=A0A1H8PR81_9HYPH|nr:DUF6118 family protein [Rhizobium tibeticum]SEH98592.1 hypothetical protein RTCCBAU85039_3504 [Rhizobium tibeticum]SEO44043.1 hypothetical protein SAMN05216228_101765 [Rhizobium tibeticum]
MTHETPQFERRQQEDGDPAQAFDALRLTVETLVRELGSEMTIIRKGVETAFEEFERFQQPADYGPDLGRIVQQLGIVAERLDTIEKSPALRNGVDHHARVLESVADRVLANAGRMLDARGGDLEHISAELGHYIRSVRDRRSQNWRILGAGAAGLLLGSLVVLFAPRMLPGPVDVSLAAIIMNADRWNGGISLMRSGSPEDWSNLVAASNLVRANQEALAVCAETAARAMKDQSCAINVSAPAQHRSASHLGARD